ncbi:ATP-binding protein [Paraburkholderia sp. BL6669N2]|uniref:ATP-binding protein n=1 Tax=Paraburkholderia sp. BL6669N2 TaxID=1938807 RepID=UPI0038D37010
MRAQGPGRDQRAVSKLIAERYERKSLLITANQPFSGWNDVFPDPGMTVAPIDRLVHHFDDLRTECGKLIRRRKGQRQQSARRRQLPDDNTMEARQL